MQASNALVSAVFVTVIAGRNGSGKSTLAQAGELALTGVNSRWKDKAAVWSKRFSLIELSDKVVL